MTPIPISVSLRGGTKRVGVEIVEQAGQLVAVAIWDNGDRVAPMDVWDDEAVEAAWWPVALDVTRSEDHRRQAIRALMDIAVEMGR